MYQRYFDLAEAPFSIAPDPRYLFLSEKHREALAHLIYGVGDQGGFVLLTGEVGTGKTTICRSLLQQIPDNADVAYIINPKQSINQLLQSIFSELRINYEKGRTSRDLIDDLNKYLLGAHAAGRNTILIIDEAQNLTVDVLEQLRLLTNLETNEKKLLQLVLLGQPELNDILSKPELRQLAQRITARFHLGPLSKSEVAQYITHRLSVAGCRSELFSNAAIATVFKFSRGIPRLINQICDRSLLGAYATNGDMVTKNIAKTSSKEVLFDTKPVALKKWRTVIIAVLIAALVLLMSYMWKSKLLEDENSERSLDSVQVNNQSAFLTTGGGKAAAFVQSSVTNQSSSKAGMLISHQPYYPEAELSNTCEEALLEILRPAQLEPGMQQSDLIDKYFVRAHKKNIAMLKSSLQPLGMPLSLLQSQFQSQLQSRLQLRLQTASETELNRATL